MKPLILILALLPFLSACQTSRVGSGTGLATVAPGEPIAVTLGAGGVT